MVRKCSGVASGMTHCRVAMAGSCHRSICRKCNASPRYCWVMQKRASPALVHRPSYHTKANLTIPRSSDRHRENEASPASSVLLALRKEPLRSRHRSRMEYVVKFPTRPRTQSLTCGASLRAVLPLVLLDETLLPANLRALLEATSPHLCASLRRLTC